MQCLDLILLDEKGDRVSKESEKKTLRIAKASLTLTTIFALLNFGYVVLHNYYGGKSSDARFQGIETALRMLTGAVAPQLQKAVDDSLTSAVSAPANDASDKISYAEAVIHQLSDAKVSLPKDALVRTSYQFNALADSHETSPQTWSAIGEFITYRSQVIQGWEQTNLPACTDQLLQWRVESLTPAPTPNDPNAQTLTHGPFEVHDCKIILDSPEATRWLSIGLSFADVVLKHCAVFYTGGPIIVVPVKVATQTPPKIVGTMNFENCLFVFNIARVPTPQGQQLTRIMLTAKSGDIQFKPDAG